jgi:hypothetical protein
MRQTGALVREGYGTLEGQPPASCHADGHAQTNRRKVKTRSATNRDDDVGVSSDDVGVSSVDVGTVESMRT